VCVCVCESDDKRLVLFDDRVVCCSCVCGVCGVCVRARMRVYVRERECVSDDKGLALFDQRVVC